MIYECGHRSAKVVNSRSSEFWITRRRECTHCGTRYTTIEFPLPFNKGDVPVAIIQKVFAIDGLRRNINRLIGLLTRVNSDLPNSPLEGD